MTAANDIRVWHAGSQKQLLKIDGGEGAICHCCIVSPDGSMILTGWNDNTIRAHTPETGKEVWVIRDAH